MTRSQKNLTQKEKTSEELMSLPSRSKKTYAWGMMIVIVLGLGIGVFYGHHKGLWSPRWEASHKKKKISVDHLNQLQADHKILHQRLNDISTQLTLHGHGSKAPSTAIDLFKRDMKKKMGILARYLMFSQAFYQGGPYTEAYQDLARVLPDTLKGAPAFQQLGTYAGRGLPSVGQILGDLKSSYRHMPVKANSLYERLTSFLSAFIQITSPDTLELRRHLETLIQEGKLKEALIYRDEHFASRSISTHLIEERLQMLNTFNQFNQQMMTAVWESP